jgi:hypothetical protein
MHRAGKISLCRASFCRRHSFALPDRTEAKKGLFLILLNNAATQEESKTGIDLDLQRK